jgi:hypothetical protein
MAMLELLHLTAAASQPSQQQPTTVVAWKRATATVEIQQQREQNPHPPAAADVVGGGDGSDGFLVLRTIPSQHQQQIHLHRCVFGKEDLLAASPQPKPPTMKLQSSPSFTIMTNNEISSPSLHHHTRNPPNLPNVVTAADG